MDKIDKKEIIRLIIKISLLVIFVLLLTLISIVYAPWIMKLISNSNKFKEYILSFKMFGIIVYLLFQIIQVIIVIIPGEFIQIAGGYIYGTILGTVFTFTGILLGTIIVFFISKMLGYSVIKIFIPKEKMEKYNFLINSPKAEIIMFVLFLIPGLPKDALTYIAGLTPVKPLRFFLLCMIARFPGILGSAFIGAKLEAESYMAVIIVSIIALVLFVLGVIFQKRIIDFVHTLQHKKEIKKPSDIT